MNYKDKTYSIKNRLINSSLWSVISSIVERGAVLYSFVIAGRMLTRETFGEFGLVFSTVAMASIFAGFGLQTTSARYVSEFYKNNPRRTGEIIGLCIFSSVLIASFVGFMFYVNADLLAHTVYKTTHLEVIFKAASLYLTFEAIQKSQLGILIGFERFKNIFFINILKGVALIIGFTFGIKFYSVIGGVFAFAISSGVALLFQSIIILNCTFKSRIKIIFSNIIQDITLLIKFSLPAFLASAMVTPAIWGAHTILATIPNGFEQMGILTAVTRFQSAINMVGIAIGNAILPILLSLKDNYNIQLQKSNILISWFTGIVMSLPLILFPEILVIVFGELYGGIEVQYTLVVVMVYTIISLYKQGLGRLFIVHNHMWWSFLSNGFWAITMLIFAFALKSFGSIGIALSFLIAYSSSTIIFIPVFISNNLVSKKLLISKKIIILWILILITVVLRLIGLPILPTIFYTVILTISLIYLFIGIIKE